MKDLELIPRILFMRAFISIVLLLLFFLPVQSSTLPIYEAKLLDINIRPVSKHSFEETGRLKKVATAPLGASCPNDNSDFRNKSIDSQRYISYNANLNSSSNSSNSSNLSANISPSLVENDFKSTWKTRIDTNWILGDNVMIKFNLIT